MNIFKILHTADWHLGARLCGQTRDREHSAFLDWLVEICQAEQPDALIIAGDIFDSATPPLAAQSLYYRFLHRAAAHCRHIIAVGGNHDSAAFLDAPRALLKHLSTHVLGASACVEDEVVRLQGAQGQGVIALVPFLRDRDVRRMQAGETLDDKTRATAQGIAAHYARAAQAAEALRAGDAIPAIATGHLFATGGITHADDGVRDIHVGHLAYVGADTFGQTFDYVALGHLHRAQTVGGHAHIRYSGAPLALGFGETDGARDIVRVCFHGREPDITPIPIPGWQTLTRLSGTRETLAAQLQALVAQGENIWVEAHLEAATFDSHAHDALQTLVQDSSVKLLRLHNAARRAEALSLQSGLPDLQTLTPAQVFAARLAADHTLDDARKNALTHAFAELLAQMDSHHAH